MREMHKWKDKVELNLDNRQIFFLFFGLSVVGCFVFALGVMVGRRVELGPGGEVAALSADSLSILDGHGETQTELSFQEGLKTSSIDELPPMRDLEAEAALAKRTAETAAPSEAAPAPKTADSTASKPEPAVGARKSATPRRKPQPATKRSDVALAASAPKAGSADAGRRKFTLQMKAFSKREEADTLAAELQAKGHDARVESQQVKGRLWHRVRVGSFDTWSEGLKAKDAFESSEKTIAYVVRK